MFSEQGQLTCLRVLRVPLLLEGQSRVEVLLLIVFKWSYLVRKKKAFATLYRVFRNLDDRILIEYILYCHTTYIGSMLYSKSLYTLWKNLEEDPTCCCSHFSWLLEEVTIYFIVVFTVFLTHSYYCASLHLLVLLRSTLSRNPEIDLSNMFAYRIYMTYSNGEYLFLMWVSCTS